MENFFIGTYGVKAEKAKHRKSRKAKRLEGTYHQGKYSFRCYRKYYLEKYRKTKFKQNRLLILEEAYSDYMEIYFGDTEEDYYGFEFDPNWEEPNENDAIVGDDWKRYAHFDENTLAEIAKETEDKYCTFNEAFAENLRQYNMGFENEKKYILDLLEKKGIKINLELLEN